MTLRLLILFLGLILIGYTLGIGRADAHGFGPPFFKVNGVYADYYQIQTWSAADLTFPQDAPPANYFVDKSIDFEIDQTLLPFDPTDLKKMEFSWDFGDGTTGDGLANTHTYHHGGSYILSIDAKAADGQSGLIESIMLHVYPNDQYQLPIPRFTVNGQPTTSDLDTPLVLATFGQAMTFDASQSQGSSSPITSYIWDFGDGKSATGKVVSHTFSEHFPGGAVTLRVKDDQGFVNDVAGEIQNKDNYGNFSPTPVKGLQTPTSTPSVPIEKEANQRGTGLSSRTEFIWATFAVITLGLISWFVYRRRG